MLSKVDKVNIAGTMVFNKEYVRSCHGIMRVPLAYVIRKTITVPTYDDYPKYTIPDNEMMMLCLPPDKI